MLALFAVFALGLTACGDDPADESSGDEDTTTVEAVGLIRSASTTTAEAGSAHVDFDATVSDIPGAPEVEFGGEGEIDFEEQVGTLTFELGDLPGLPGGGSIEQVFAGTTLYLRGDVLGPLPGGAEWVRLDTVEAAAEAGVDLQQLPTFGSSNPADALALLEGASEDGVEEVGDEEIDGVETTHYRAEIDLRATYENSDAVTDREAFEAFLDQLGDDPLETDIWLDDEGRVVQQSFEQPLPVAEGVNASMQFTMTFSDFGTEVDVQVPDDSDTVDALDLAGAGTGGITGDA
jgi:hypothetical protein